MTLFIETLSQRQDQLISALIEHIQLSFIALFFAVLISIPLGIYLTRKETLAETIIGVTAVLQTIPSLALLGLFIPLFGIGKVPAVIALTIYALLPIVRNTFTGIKEVDDSLIEAATAMGMNSIKRLVKVEIPLAMPVIMAGIRTAMVLIVGTATLAALIGAGGLGDIILLGIDRNNTSLIFIGAIPAAILAILFDLILRKLEKVNYKYSITAIVAILVLTLGLTLAPSFLNQEDETIVIGGKLGAEPEILVEMYKALIEEELDVTVRTRSGLGGTTFVFNALDSGEIDLYPEFTGTVLGELIREQAETNSAEAVYAQARSGVMRDYNMALLEPMAFNNTYALAVTETLAKTYNLETISDLERAIDDIKAGFTLEFSDREDGYLGIQSLYNLTFSSLQTMEPSLRYQAIESGDINLIDAYSTDPELERYNLVVLEDDKELFPPYQGAPLLRQETLDQYPQLESILNQLSGRITSDEMREMNYRVGVENEEAAVVAKEYLTEQGLIN